MAIERRSTYGTFSGQNSLNTLTTAVCSTVFGSVGHTAGDVLRFAFQGRKPRSGKRDSDERKAGRDGEKIMWPFAGLLRVSFCGIVGFEYLRDFGFK
jgi:hypothetical protein